MKTFNEWLSVRENDEHLVRCPWCDTEYLQNGQGCPKCGGGAYDMPKKSMTDLEHKRMASWQKELDAAEDEWQRIALKHKSNGMSWGEIYKIPEAREAYHKYTDVRQHINSSPNNEAWKMRPWDAQQQQRYDKNVEFRKNNPDLPLYPRDGNYHAMKRQIDNQGKGPHLGEGVLDYFNTGRKGKVAREKLIRSIYDDPHYPDYPSPRFGPYYFGKATFGGGGYLSDKEKDDPEVLKFYSKAKRRRQEKIRDNHAERLHRQKLDKHKEEVWNSMPKDLQDKLNSNLKFVGTYDDGVEGPWKADGLKKAISDAYMVGWCQGEGCTMKLRYKDADTEVQVYNSSNGWGTDPTQISVVHKGQQFNWSE